MTQREQFFNGYKKREAHAPLYGKDIVVPT